MTKSSVRRRDAGCAEIFLGMLMALFLSGCSTPPSVAPLIRVTERVLLEESQRLARDAERDRVYTDQLLRSLEEAYGRDLEEAPGLTPAWVREATTVYVAAREAIVEHRDHLAQQRNDRIDNLNAAASAARRAVALVEQQDRLLGAAADPGLQRLININPSNKQGASR